ncbi:25653_t:CDS:2, partial [Gigaspora rosea]
MFPFLGAPVKIYRKNAVYYPTIWLPNGHLQTPTDDLVFQVAEVILVAQNKVVEIIAVYAAYANFNGIHLINYERQLVETPDGGQIAIDWTPPISQKPFDNTPTIVVLHGLTG